MIGHRPCVLCGGTERMVEFELEIGTVVRCHGCELVTMVEPGGIDLVRCTYDEAYYGRADAPGPGYTDYFGAEAADRRAIAGSLADLLLAFAPAGRRSLDLGCGGGFLVHALTAKGMEAHGVDASEHAIGRARERPGRFVLGAIGDRHVADLAPFDVVTVIDVIEHLPDPVSALRNAVRLLRPDGVLLILTPRYGGRLLSEQGAGYVHFNTDHMYYFTEKTLRAVIAAGTGSRNVVVDDVLGMLREYGIVVPDSMAHKYGSERDSMLARVII